MAYNQAEQEEDGHRIYLLEGRLRLLKTRYKTMRALHNQCIAARSTYISAPRESQLEQDVERDFDLTSKALRSALDDLEKGTF